MKILTVVGARPQFIKAATISRVFREINQAEVIVHTGQHFDLNMSEIFFQEMEIPKPDHFLNINGMSHGAMTGQMIIRIEEVLKTELPDLVIVYGDTNSTLAGALAAVKLHIPVAHVEAGLRSFNNAMPEEINRILTDRISKLLYCPSPTAIDNLEREGFKSMDCDIYMSGDVMYDAALYYSKKSGALNTLDKFKLKKNGFYLCTIHRAENTDHIENLQNIIEALNHLHEKMEVVMPLHPRTKKIIAEAGLKTKFRILDPVGYFDMINLINGSRMVLTDSGGVQKEAYFFKKFCITMRDQTEWTELVKSGYNILTGANSHEILRAIDHFDSAPADFSTRFYGDGRASYRIVDHLLKRQ